MSEVAGDTDRDKSAKMLVQACQDFQKQAEIAAREHLTTTLQLQVKFDRGVIEFARVSTNKELKRDRFVPSDD